MSNLTHILKFLTPIFYIFNGGTLSQKYLVFEPP